MCHNGIGEPLGQRTRDIAGYRDAATRPDRRGRQCRLLPILYGDGKGSSPVGHTVGHGLRCSP